MLRRNPNPRLHLVFLIFALAFLLLLARLVFVQIFQSPRLKSYAQDQHNVFIQIMPKRGLILDGKYRELAVNAVSYSIFATDKFQTPQDKIDKLSALLGLDKKDLAKKLNTPKKFVWLKRKISPELAQQVKDLELSGVGQIREDKRFYPEGSFACHILGFTDIDNHGLEAAELYYEPYLAGTKGWRLAQRDAKRREVICWNEQSILPLDGYNVVLTIDSIIQNIAERHLRKAAAKYKATQGMAIVMQPKTGEILALCNYPEYDLNAFGDYPQQLRRNLAISDMFEPGSSFKFVTVAAALEEKRVKITDKFYCEKGVYRLGRRILHDYKPYAELNVKEIISHSSNIGTVKIAQTLEAKTLYKYIKDFGFGSLTDIDLPGEAKGIVRPVAQWSGISISSIPMGQEVGVTALQLITAMSCLANDGILVKPKIVKSIQQKAGQEMKAFPTQEVRRVISSETANALKEILTAVVEEGTGKLAQVAGYQTAGKTGTAQKAKAQGGYYKNKYVSSFVGFVPADQPLIAVLVVLNEPRPYFGGTVCAPVFSQIATETLRYLKMTNEAQTYGTE
ncbi:MAG: penicillin-binding protein [Candidatus Omnitrophica bacterium]|nr:penicillin-binding protein [Candidatus Omnitrophota bacterium]